MSQISGVLLQLPAGSVNGKAIADNAEILYSQMKQRVLQTFPVPWTSFRTWDAWASNPVSSAASDDLALSTGALTASGAAGKITAGDVKNTSATRRIACFIPIPDHYDDGETIQLRIRAAMETTVASSSCTVDAEAFVVGTGSTVGVDLVSTAAQSMNSLTVSDYDFTITASSVDPGNLLEVRITIASVDSATATAVTPAIYSVELLCDTRG